jgi:hypothetical protein
MWKRIAARYALWYEPRVLASYRQHSASQTARLKRSGRNIEEIRVSIARSASLLDDADAPRVARAARRAYAVFALQNVLESLANDRDRAAAQAQWREAKKLASGCELARAAAWIALRTVKRVGGGARKPQLEPPGSSIVSAITRLARNLWISSRVTPRT